MTKKYNRETFLPYLTDLIDALSIDFGNSREGSAILQKDLDKLGLELKEIMVSREQARSDFVFTKEKHRVSGIRNTDDRKNLWADLDNLETKFVKLTDQYRDKCAEIVEVQNKLSEITKKFAKYELVLSKFNTQISLLSIVTVRFKTGDLMRLSVVPQFVRKSANLDIDFVAEDSPIGNALLGQKQDKVVHYTTPNGLLQNIEVVLIEVPEIDICKKLYEQIYNEKYKQGFTYRIATTFDRTHRDRTNDGARDNWLLQCSVCNGYNGRDHRCSCYLL